MKTNKKSFFLSYSWANRIFADEIDTHFQQFGIKIIRDVRDSTYRTSIKTFMQQIGKVNYVFMLISDEFLKSANCMYEVIELLNSHELEERLLPLVLPNANNIYSVDKRKEYYEFWEQQFKQKSELLRQYVNEDFLEQKKTVENITLRLPEFFSKLVDLNCKSYAELKKESFIQILDVIGESDRILLKRLQKISLISDAVQQELELDVFLRENPEFSNAWFYKGYLAAKNGEKDRSIEYYKICVSIDPNNVEAMNNLSELLMHHARDYFSARDYLKRAFAVDDKVQRTQSNLNEVESEFNKIHKMISELIVESAEDSAKVMNYGKIGHLYTYYLRDANKGLEYFEKALEIDPNCEEIIGEMINLNQFVLKNYKLTRKYYEQLVALKPNSIEVLNNYASILMDFFNDHSAARRIFERAIAIDDNNYNLHFNLAGLLGKEFNDSSGAIAHLQKAVKINPNKANAHYWLMHYMVVSSTEWAKQFEHLEMSDDEEKKVSDQMFANRMNAKEHYIAACNLDPDHIHPRMDEFFHISR